MGRKVRIAVAACFVVMFAAGVWYFESPVWTLSRMKAAAEADDPEALNRYIDYPALRESLRQEIDAKLADGAPNDSTGLSALKSAIGAAIAGPVIDSLVTPTGMRAALRARHDQKVQSADGPSAVFQLPDQPVIERRGFSEFMLSAKSRPGSGMLFKREGLSWKLSGVELGQYKRQ